MADPSSATGQAVCLFCAGALRLVEDTPPPFYEHVEAPEDGHAAVALTPQSEYVSPFERHRTHGYGYSNTGWW